ncbi:cell division protein ZapA [Magnetospira thiophila]
MTVEINGRKYQIACDDGQEAHLTRLAAYIDKQLGKLVTSVGQIGDARLLVMASLMIADELSEAYSELEVLRGGDGGSAVRRQADDNLAERLEVLAHQVETVAQRLEEA